MIKIKSEIIVSQKRLFYRSYFDDIYNRKKKFKHDELFEKLNNYHSKIKLTVEVSPTKFLDISLHLNNGIYDFEVYMKSTKQSIHWSSKIPKRYKRNMILRDLPQSNRISSNVSEEISFISHKYEKADYHKRFINSVIRQFQNRSNQSNIDDFDEYIIPSNFFDILKSFFLIELPLCEISKINSKDFLMKFHRFTKDLFEVAIKWKTRQVKTLFPLKEERILLSCVFYKGTCSFGETYIGGTIRNASIRWEEHNNPTKMSQLPKHLKNNFHLVFNWVILCKAPQKHKFRRNLEASYIALLKPTLNEKDDFEVLTPFKNGVTFRVHPAGWKKFFVNILGWKR